MFFRLLIALLVGCGHVQAQQLSVPGTANTTTYQMGDDGSVNVPLPFTFNYYGKSFNNSWMYDNGVISFVQPGTPGALSPNQWNPPSSLSQSNANYFIAPLWMDLAPVQGSTYSTTGDGTYLRYDWKNLSEYYSGGTRLNSFSSTIRPDGSISTSYYSLNIETSNLLVGTVGDISKGEVSQLYNASFGTRITTGALSNWTQTTVNPCDTNPLYSPTCAGYSAAITKLLPPVSNTVEPVVPSTSPTETTSTATVTQPIQQTTTPLTTISLDSTQPTNTSSVAKSSSNKETTSTSNTSLGLSVISRNQQREQNIASTAVQNAISTSESASSQSQQEAMAVASMAVSNSTVSSVTSSNQSQTGTGIRIQSNNTQFGLSSNNMANTTGVTENTVNGYNNALTDRTNPLNEYIEPRTNLSNSNQATINSTVNRNAGNNEVAGGVDINRMALAPTGYNDYLNLTLRDSAFYAPKEVYKNQKNVDNARVLRQLTNDSKHRDMVEQQYRR